MNEKTFMCLVQVLGKCKRWGYTDVWFNMVTPHTPAYWTGGHLVASPPSRRGGSNPAIWSLSYDPLEREVLGDRSCGNAMGEKADQMQFYTLDKYIPPSHYTLVDGDWLLEEELNVEETTNGI